MMAVERFASFAEFWPYYVREHSRPLTRALHVIGTLGAIGFCVAAVVAHKPWLAACAPLSGYGLAWISHFFVEKNRPATWTYPLWSLLADFVLLARILTLRSLD